MSAPSDVVGIVKDVAAPASFEFDAIFRQDYGRLARLITRVIRDPARAEELSVEAFWKLWKTPSAQGESARGWLRRTAVRLALDDLRRRARRDKYERLLMFGRRPATPDELFASAEEQGRVRAVLAALPRRDAELLLLRSDDTSYEELATMLSLNPASVGTLLNRARQAFRKAYVKKYGEQ